MRLPTIRPAERCNGQRRHLPPSTTTCLDRQLNVYKCSYTTARQKHTGSKTGKFYAAGPPRPTRANLVVSGSAQSTGQKHHHLIICLHSGAGASERTASRVVACWRRYECVGRRAHTVFLARRGERCVAHRQAQKAKGCGVGGKTVGGGKGGTGWSNVPNQSQETQNAKRRGGASKCANQSVRARTLATLGDGGRGCNPPASPQFRHQGEWK